MPNISQLFKAISNTRQAKPLALKSKEREAASLIALSAYMEQSSPTATVHDIFLAGFDAGDAHGRDKAFDAALRFMEDCLRAQPVPVAGEVS